MFGVGACVGLAFYGYSLVTGKSDNMNVLSDAFSKALAKAQLQGTAEGIVQIEPNEIVLASGQTVTLDRQSRVSLDPTARVLAEGYIRMNAPPAPAQTSASQQRTALEAPITNFTVFKGVSFDKGTVMTGWKFATSADKSPTEEYCYYAVRGSTPGFGVSINLGKNGRLDVPEEASKDFNVMAAFEKCVWFGSITQ